MALAPQLVAQLTAVPPAEQVQKDVAVAANPVRPFASAIAAFWTSVIFVELVRPDEPYSAPVAAAFETMMPVRKIRAKSTMPKVRSRRTGSISALSRRRPPRREFGELRFIGPSSLGHLYWIIFIEPGRRRPSLCTDFLR